VTELDPATLNMIRGLARKVSDLERRVRDQARASQASMRSLEEGDQQELYDDEGELRGVVGQLEDGSYGVEVFGGSELPPPSQPLVATFPAGATITWDGFDAHDESGWGPAFARVTVHLATIPGAPADLETHIGSFESPDGGSLSIAQPSDVTTYCQFVAWSTSGIPSPPSVEVEVTGGILPAPEVPDPTDPPTETVTIEATGTVDSIIVEASEVDPQEHINYYIGTTPGFVQDESTLYISTNSRVIVVTSLPDGTPLATLDADGKPVFTTPYYIVAKRANVVGEGPASVEVSTTLDQFVASELIKAKVTAGFGLFGKITVGQMTIDHVLGVTIPQPGGGEIRFPVDGSNASFSGILTAIQQLTVSGASTFNNLVNLGAIMRIGAGVADPVDGVSLTPAWTSQPQMLGLPPVATPEDFWHGLCDDPSGTYWVYVSTFFGCDIRLVSKANGAFFHQVNLSVESDPGGYYGENVTRIGSYYYVLARRRTTGARFVVKIDATTYAEVARTSDVWSSAFWTKKPTIGTDSADVYVIGINGANYKWTKVDPNHFAQVRNVTGIVYTPGTIRFNLDGAPTGLTVGATVVTADGFANGTRIVKTVGATWYETDGPNITDSQPGGGTATWQRMTPTHQTDFATGISQRDAEGMVIDDAGVAGGNRIWVALRATGALGAHQACYLFTTKARETANEFPRAGNNDPRGLWWDNTRFWNLDADAVMWKYGTNVTSPTLEAGWTGADEDPLSGVSGHTTHETGISPLTSYVWPLRSLVKIETPPAPEAHITDPGLHDKADRIKVYVANPAGGTLRLQGGGALAVGVRSLTLETIATATATPGANTFGGIGGLGVVRTVGALPGGNPVVEIFGTGQGRMGPYEWDDDGVITSPYGFAEQGAPQSLGNSVSVVIGLTLNEASDITWGSNAFTITRPGLYEIAGGGQFPPGGTAGRRVIEVTLNGAQFARFDTSSSTRQVATVNKIARLAIGAELRLEGFQTSGGALDFSQGFLWVRRISY
jgi:hypothetical protein